MCGLICYEIEEDQSRFINDIKNMYFVQSMNSKTVHVIFGVEWEQEKKMQNTHFYIKQLLVLKSKYQRTNVSNN